MKPNPIARNDWLGLLKQTASEWIDDGALRLSAALAYYSVFSIAPLLVIAIGIAGAVLGYEAAAGQIQTEMQNYVGVQAAAAVQSMVKSASQRGNGWMATVIGFVTLFIGASGVFGELKSALNTIWNVNPTGKAGWKKVVCERFMNFGMVLVIGFLLLVSLVMTTAIAALNHRLESLFSLPAFVWSAIAFVISFGIVTTLFSLIFKVLPDVKIRWHDVWIGAAITALLFEVGKTGLGWYLGRESTASAYGAAGSVVLLLLWVYYASCILFFGAEFTQVYAQAEGRRIQPSDNAACADEPSNGASSSVSGAAAVASATAAFSASDPTYFARVPVGVSGPFAHSLSAPVLKYLEARGMLLSIEAKEALRQSITLLVLAVLICIGLLISWMLLTTALVGLLTQWLGGSWLKAVSITGGIHIALVVAAAMVMWLRFKNSNWFADTLRELKKDRTWIQGQTVKI